jgi:hypothetical protein
MPKPAAAICWKVAPLIHRDRAFCSFSRASSCAGRELWSPRVLLALWNCLHQRRSPFLIHQSVPIRKAGIYLPDQFKKGGGVDLQ